MSCTNCFNGCAEIVSDKCVKYTGINIPGLNIYTGDNLLTVENKITEKILTLMDGTGIIPKIDPADICTIVKSYLPCCLPLTLNDILTALIKSVCAIDARLVVAENKLIALNADYITDCLAGVTASSDTHEVLQASINKLCETAQGLSNLAAEVAANYVPINKLDDYIKQYLATLSVNTKNYTKMIPLVVYPYWGGTVGFDSTGIGSGIWEQVYLCNGDHGTPDLRGRVPVGATSMPGNNPLMSPDVAPGGDNPTYNVGSKVGQNSVFLLPPQVPTHTHIITITLDDPGHFHTYQSSISGGGAAGGKNIIVSPTGVSTIENLGTWGTSGPVKSMTGLIGDKVPPDVNQNVKAVASNAGEGKQHLNYQPGIGLNYIIHIPNP